MRRMLLPLALPLLLSASIPALAQTEGTHFRLQLSAPIFFNTGADQGADNGGGTPNPGGNTNISVAFDPSVVTNGEVRGRLDGTLSVPMTVSGIDSTYTIEIDGAPGASWVPTGSDHGSGNFVWTLTAGTAYTPSIVVKNGNGDVVHTASFDLEIVPALSVSVPQSQYEVDVGATLSIPVTVGNRIGAIDWSSVPATLPSWLDFDPQALSVEVDTAVARAQTSVSLTAIDKFDNSDDSASFSVTVNALGPDTTPDAFTIAALSDTEPRWDAISAPVTPVGYEVPVTISATAGAQVSVANGAFVNSATISPGQSFRLKVKAPNQSLTVTPTVTIGTGAATSWSVTSWAENVKTITASTSAANPATLFGAAWTDASVRKRLMVQTNTVVSSTSSTVPALNIANTLRGSLIIENAGTIAGAGGAGGAINGGAGQVGGTGLALSVTGVKVINNGIIAGGGGGGTGGAKGADRPSSSGPATSSTYTSGSHMWCHYYKSGTSGSSDSAKVLWNGTTVIVGIGLGTGSYVKDGYTYIKGSAQSGAKPSECMAVYSISRSQVVAPLTGGNGGVGGAGAAYPTTPGTAGQSGVMPNGGSSDNMGKQGGQGGGYGQQGGNGGGLAGFAISGTPATGSVLGTKYGR